MKHKRIISLLIACILISVTAFSIHPVFAENNAGEGYARQAFSKSDKVENFRNSSSGVSIINLKWDEAEGADGYLVQMKKNGAYETVKKTVKNSCTIKELKSGKVYYLRIRAYAEDGLKTVSGKWVYLHAATKPDAVKVKSIESDNKKVTLKWKKTNCSGYQINLSTKADFSSKKSKTLSGENVTYTTSSLKGETVYYFRIRAYRTCNDKNYYSDWTNVSVKTDRGYKTTSKGYKIEEKNGVTYVDGVLVANKTYSIPNSYNPGGLTKECSSAFNKMKAAAQKDGVNLFIVSGFRSYETQRNLYNRYVAKDGKALADTYSARPGTSEHQTGLAMDLNSLQGSFGETKEGRWLASNCHKYGFIIRYPKGKQSITGYIYEPWHVRYLGTDTATKIYKSGLCLEEYYGITSRYN